MGLLNLVSALRHRDQKWTARAERIAADVLETLWPQYEQRLAGMKLSEARGYLRARARGSVRSHIESGDVRPAVQLKMKQHALDEVVRRGVSRLLAAPQPVVVPIPVAAPLRRAA